MQRLSTLDTLFASLDTRQFPMHGAGALVLDPSTAPQPLTLERVKDHFRRLLPAMPPLRRRLVTVPLGLDVPMWIEDPDFELDRHFSHRALPAPGSDEQLADLLGEVSTPYMERDRPLWDCTFVEGLANGKVAIILRMHHACIDGMGGVEMLMQMFSTDPSVDVQADVPADDWVPDHVPGELELLLDTAPRLTTLPYRSMRAIARMAVGTAKGRLSGLLSHEAEEATGEMGRPFGGPKLSFNEIPETLNRRAAWADVSMDDIRAIRAGFPGAKVNDVALALSAGAIRRYLESRGELPDGPIQVANPLNTRAPDDKGEFSNNVAILSVSLPVHLPDPRARLERIVENTRAAKGKAALSGTNALEDLFDIVSPGTAHVLAAQLTGNPAARALPPAYNACVTNLIGPPMPLYFCGARMTGFRIQMMQGVGVGLVVALISYAGDMQMTVTGSREVMDDVWAIANGIEEERRLLLQIAAQA